jgi:hypothetical protein
MTVIQHVWYITTVNQLSLPRPSSSSFINVLLAFANECGCEPVHVTAGIHTRRLPPVRRTSTT